MMRIGHPDPSKEARVDRRGFLKLSLKGVAGIALAKGMDEIFRPREGLASVKPVRWGFLVDTYKCIGCGFCVRACKLENEIPYEANVSRTWVERYVITKDGRVFADTPKEARNGFTNRRVDLGMGRNQDIKGDEIDKAFFVPKLCNQCDKPPCVQVCPVGATYKTEDGVVLIDQDHCIGCRYCIQACPYGARYFLPEKKVVDKCTWCYHRISQGLVPACVEVCPVGARVFGDLRDPASQLKSILAEKRTYVLKPALGTEP